MTQPIFILETPNEVTDVVTSWQQANISHINKMADMGASPEELFVETINRFSKLPLKNLVAVNTDVVPVVFA